MQKKTITQLLIFGVLAIIIVVKLYNGKSGTKAPEQKAGKNAIPVTGFIVKAQNSHQTIATPGKLEASQEVNITSEISGRVTDIFIVEGSRVKKGQLLVQLNNSDLLAQLKKAEAIQTLKQEIFNRNSRLVKSGAVSQEEFNISQSELLSSNADIALLKEQIRKTAIRAPFDGNIGFCNLQPGSLVQPAQIITTLSNLSELKLTFSLPDKLFGELKPGSSVNFKTSLSDEMYGCKIYAVEPKLDETTKNLQFRAKFINTPQFPSGTYADVFIKPDNQKKLIVPTHSIVPVLKGQQVFVLHADSVEVKEVKTGNRSDGFIEIESGLNPGDTVISGGIMFMRKGVKVKLTQMVN